MSRQNNQRSGFSLVELLVVIGIIGVLMGLLFPAVQAARESARATQCANNLKNIGHALANYHAARMAYPLGSDQLAGTEQAWSSRILPFLEEANIGCQINYSQPWNAPGQNQQAANQNVSTYVCPSAVVVADGKQDYGGITGTALTTMAAGTGPNQAFGCGILIVTSKYQTTPVNAAHIPDGLSCTLIAGESVDRVNSPALYWACGQNCFAQGDPWVNYDNDVSGLHSYHSGGANGVFADGHVTLINDQIASTLLGAICTRNGAESEPMSGLAN